MVRCVAVIVFLLIFTASGSASACVYISEVYPNPIGTNNEWVELYNNCSTRVNLSEFIVTDNVSRHFYGLYGEAEARSFVIAANNVSLLPAGIPANVTIVDIGIGSSWLNVDGDRVFLLNYSILLDSTVYGELGSETSWSLCNETWVETSATPGYANVCPEEENNVTGNETQNGTDENETKPYDYSSISVEVESPSDAVRFGDFAQVKAVLHTNGQRVPLRIVAYIYKPHWVSTELDGDTIHYYLNDTQAALEIESMDNGSELLLYLPLFIKENCAGNYESGIYTGNVRVYHGETDDIVAEDKFNITLDGNNVIFCKKCESCPKCKKCECSCSGTSGSGNSGSGTMELLGFEEIVEAGEPFETSVKVKNTGAANKSFIIYSYGYEGSRCLTYGLNSGKWSKGWTANEQSFSLEPGSSEDIVMRSAFANETTPGVYNFRIRLKYDGRQEDITRPVRVEAAKPVIEENLSGDVEIVFEDAENKTMNTSGGITGMVTSESGEPSGLRSIYESFLSWLASIFKF